MGCCEVCSCNTGFLNLEKKINLKDRFYWFLARTGLKRTGLSIKPGLYRLGNPDKNSDVFVTANYRLSVDALKIGLKELDAWILVLDTKGVNVWCAAGKGTFGTQELISQIKQCKLTEIVNHKRLILPQLSAPGVNSNEVFIKTGFKVFFGPVRAEDINQYITNHYNADEKMRTVNFKFFDRIKLIPVELKLSLKYIFFFFILFLAKNYFLLDEKSIKLIINNSLKNVIPVLGGLVCGTVLIPMFLPYIPFKAFFIKGFYVGVIYTVIIFNYLDYFGYGSILEKFSVVIWTIVISSLSSLNFTGCSTYTSFSGVKKEIDIFYKPSIFFIVLGFIFYFSIILLNK
ncbi:MAG: mercury methylation corrinoid protein HgcA [Candidatus Muiribacteriota bacterium]